METKPLPREAILVVNAHSRRGQDAFAQAKKGLEAAGLRLLAAHAVEEPEKMAETVRDAIASGAPMVIVGGGDGSMSGTVDEFVGKDCVFGVLPLGTANSFARTLGLPLDLDGAVQAIASGKRRRVDLGMVERDYFVNAASLGLSPMIGRTVPHKLKRYLGRIGYLLWALKCSVDFRPFRLTIDDGHKQRRMWSTEVRILNGPYHGGVELSERADVDTGEIVIQAVVGRSKPRLAWDWYAKFFKLRDRDSHTQEWHGTSFRIDTVPRQRISIDGEVLAKTPVTVRIAPGAVEVAAPAES